MSTAEQAIRSGILETAAVLDQAQPTLSRPIAFTYVPPSHARALDPESTLVEGIRGAGKSFWFSLLASSEHRSFVQSTFPEANLPPKIQVTQGFGMGVPPARAPDADTLAALLNSRFRARSIWRAVVAHNAGIGGEFASLTNWTDRVRWTQENPESFAHEMEAADRGFAERGELLLIMFDALDRIAYDWRHIHQQAKGLLQVALDMRSMRAIRCKVFVRPDLLQDANVTSFTDYSKLFATKASLLWQRADLYALLYQCLGNAEVSRNHFVTWVPRSKNDSSANARGPWAVPSALRKDEGRQEALFERIAGKAMGSSVKRGKPYTWLVNHLQDGLNQVSPRSFLAALGEAAAETPGDFELPIDYRGIQRGVQKASQIRVREISDDFSWVEAVMKPLRGLTVPCRATEIEGAWREKKTVTQLQNAEQLPPQHLEQGAAGLLTDLEALGMVQRIDGRRIQMPDVYRVAFGLGRKGGVKPLK